jgi:hypothetical protein
VIRKVFVDFCFVLELLVKRGVSLPLLRETQRERMKRERERETGHRSLRQTIVDHYKRNEQEIRKKKRRGKRVCL